LRTWNGSTGEPWNPEPWWWYFREVGEGRCPIVNYSGGTEVSGGIVSSNVIGPIKPASFSGPCIGTAADVVERETAERYLRHDHTPRVEVLLAERQAKERNPELRARLLRLIDVRRGN